MPSETGMVGVADCARILRAVFPNYPDSETFVTRSQSLEPTWPVWPTEGADADLPWLRLCFPASEVNPLLIMCGTSVI
jgi:hypothetical protein